MPQLGGIKRDHLGALPDAGPFGPEAVAAAERLTAARVALVDAAEQLRPLTAGHRAPRLHLHETTARPADAEAAAIEEDRRLVDAAILRGDEDPGAVGTPHHDEYRRLLANAQARHRVAQTQHDEADRELYELLKANVDVARPAIANLIAEASADYQRAVEQLHAERRAYHGARALLRYLDVLADPSPVWPIQFLGGNGPEDMKVPGRVLSIDYGGLVAALRHDATPPAETVRNVDPAMSAPFRHGQPRRRATRVAK